MEGTENGTPPDTPVTGVDPENYDDSEEPRRFKSVRNLYNETEPVELEEELMLMGVEEPHNYEQAAKEHD